MAPALFKVGHKLAANLYLYLPENRTVVFFMREGDTLAEKDIAKLLALPKNSLLSLKTEAKRHQEATVQKISEAISAGNVASPQAASAAGDLLKAIQAPRLTADGDATQSFLSEVPKMAESIVLKLPPSPSKTAYEEALARAGSSYETDPILKHNAEVSAIAVLCRMSLGDSTPDELAQIATAGLLHDLGLKQIAPELANRHLSGDDQFTIDELAQYYVHSERSAAMLLATTKNPNESILWAVKLHHEKLDGTGPVGVKGRNIPLLAKILRVADDLVIAMNHPRAKLGFTDALAALALKDRHLPEPIHYDPDLIDRLASVQ